MDDFVLPAIIQRRGEPVPDLSRLTDPIRLPVEAIQYAPSGLRKPVSHSPQHGLAIGELSDAFASHTDRTGDARLVAMPDVENCPELDCGQIAGPFHNHVGLPPGIEPPSPRLLPPGDEVMSPAQGVYEFRGRTGDLYVGQTSNFERRLREHQSSGKLTPENVPTVRVSPVPGGRVEREVLEQRRIDELGGVPKLENDRNPIGPKRRRLLLDDHAEPEEQR